MIQQTEQLSRIMKTHAEDLNSGPLHRLTMMIKDKQQVKKSYVGIHQQIEAEMIKVCLPGFSAFFIFLIKPMLIFCSV
jgi:tyrosine-protein kinase Fer